MRRVAVLTSLIGLSVVAAPAHADRAVDTTGITTTASQAQDALSLLTGLAYAYVEDPDQFRRLPSAFYEAMLQDPVTAALAENALRQYRGGYLRLATTAGATADTALPVALTGAVEGSWDLPLCRVLGAHAQGLAGYDKGGIGAWALGGTACLPLPANTLQVSYTRRVNVRGSLLERPVILTDRRDEHVGSLLIRAWRWSGERNVIDVMPIELAVTFFETRDGRLGGDVGTFTAAPAEWIRRGKGVAGRDQRWTFFATQAAFQDDYERIGGANAWSVAIVPLAVDGLRVADNVAVGGEIGAVSGGDGESRTLHTVQARLSADTWLAPVLARLDLEHTLLPAYGGRIVRDDRATARAELGASEYVAHLEGFVARERIASSSASNVVGGAGDVAVELQPHLHLLARVEVARALQAGAATDPLVSRWDTRATVGITASYETRSR